MGKPVGEFTRRCREAVDGWNGGVLTMQEICRLTNLSRQKELYGAIEYLCHCGTLRRVGWGVFRKTAP